MFGGNSNWRGPVWMPFNYLLIEALQKFGHYYGDSLKVEFPTRSGNWINLWDASWNWRNAWWGCSAAMRRPASIQWSGGAVSKRSPLEGSAAFNEYFHGDNGSGVGASHQTGWTAMVLKLLTQLQRYSTP